MRIESVSVIICTRNRSSSLAKTLESFVCLNVPALNSWELLIVDNGSTDDTRKIAAGFSEVLPIRVIEEQVAGLSNARNTGVNSAVGDLILWTDDDVLVDCEWLNAYVQSFNDMPHISLMCGKSVPVFEPPEVSWFVNSTRYLSDLLAIRDFGSEAVQLSVGDDILPFGLNYAILTSVQRNFLYDPRLGVAPGRRTGGEEIDVSKRVLSAGFLGVWIPTALVYHRIPASRQTQKYIEEYYRSAGLQRADHLAEKYGPAFATIRAFYYRIFLVFIKACVLTVANIFVSRLSTAAAVPFFARLAYNKAQLYSLTNRSSQR